MKYAVTEYLVSDANPPGTEPVPMNWGANNSPVDAIAAVARIISQAEEESPHFDNYTARPVRIVIEVTP